MSDGMNLMDRAVRRLRMEAIAHEESVVKELLSRWVSETETTIFYRSWPREVLGIGQVGSGVISVHVEGVSQ